ncbi:hypothetical protein AC579_4395 [Pseudocercospora musae]|uniref:Histidine kinase n=1 Tax=Pseudocercospora musae TaxID=113226 RepID=A0A139IKA0_9PEZI|nr:hypothetical protein AC579_4395 [Pseudocercospora musae]
MDAANSHAYAYAYAYLQEHDAQWLSDTLNARARYLQQETRRSHTAEGAAVADSGMPLWQHQISHGPRAPAGPFDVTADALRNSDLLTDHIKLLRAFDWAKTDLGPMSAWSTELRRMANVCLLDNKACVLWWGPKRIAVYNEAYSHVVAHKHPAALGQTVEHIWPELVDLPYGRSFHLADTTGAASHGERNPFYVDRAGYLEEVWASWVNYPIPGPAGNLGVFNTVTDVTQEVVYTRRISTLQTLDQHTANVETVSSYWTEVLRALFKNDREVPFAALYGPVASDARRASTQSTSTSHDADTSSVSDQNSMFSGTEWTMEGVIGVRPPPHFHGLPPKVDLDSGCEILSPLFRECMESKKLILLAVSDGTMCPVLREAAKSRAFDGEQCRNAVMMPIWSKYQEHRSGFLILGLNTRREYNAAYQQFVRLLHQQLTTSLSTLVMAEDEARRNRVAARLAARDRIRLVESLAKSQQVAEHSETRFRNMADLAPIGIFEFDTHGTLLYANQRFLEMTNCATDKTPDIPSLNLALHEEDRAYSLQQWSKLLNGEQVSFEARLNRPFITDEMYGGERMTGETWVLTAAYAMRDDTDGPYGDGIKGVFGCLVDISRQKWMEGFQERQVQEQLERRRQQENFMDSTNHEARNPLAAITLCADDVYTTVNRLLAQSADGQLTLDRDNAAAILESVEIIMTCAKHQKRIIDDVLTISKLDSQMLTVNPAPMKPTDVVTQALKMFKGELRRNDVEMQYSIGSSYQACEIGWVMLDSTRFLQILVNLLTNAIKFTKHETSRKVEVRLDASPVRPTDADCGVRFAPTTSRRSSVPSEESCVYLCITIKDTGPGIVEEELQNLFQRFQQASPKTYAQYGGSGLGLWISKELCAKLGGQIGVASNTAGFLQPSPESGCTFCFYVQAPRCADPQPERPAMSASQRQSTGDVSPTAVIDANGMSTLDEGIAAIHAHLESPHGDTPTPPTDGTMVEVTPIQPRQSSEATDMDVLIVEDNLVNQRVMRKQLTRAGFRVTVANHGKEALDCIYPADTNPAHIGVVLMDIEMPVMGGLECTRIIRLRERESERTSRMPILGVTANARAEQQAEALDAGMDRVVTKPFHMSELLPAIELLRRNAASHSDNV